MAKSLAILLATSPSQQDRTSTIKLARAARTAGTEVHVFLYDEGVYNCLDKEFISLLDQGVKITLCEQSVKDRGLAISTPVDRGSLYDLACLVNQVDRLISFT